MIVFQCYLCLRTGVTDVSEHLLPISPVHTLRSFASLCSCWQISCSSYYFSCWSFFSPLCLSCGRYSIGGAAHSGDPVHGGGLPDHRPPAGRPPPGPALSITHISNRLIGNGDQTPIAYPRQGRELAASRSRGLWDRVAHHACAPNGRPVGNTALFASRSQSLSPSARQRLWVARTSQSMPGQRPARTMNS